MRLRFSPPLDNSIERKRSWFVSFDRAIEHFAVRHPARVMHFHNVGRPAWPCPPAFRTRLANPDGVLVALLEQHRRPQAPEYLPEQAWRP